MLRCTQRSSRWLASTCNSRNCCAECFHRPIEAAFCEPHTSYTQRVNMSLQEETCQAYCTQAKPTCLLIVYMECQSNVCAVMIGVSSRSCRLSGSESVDVAEDRDCRRQGMEAHISVEQIGVEELARVHQVAVLISGSLIGGRCIAVRHKRLHTHARLCHFHLSADLLACSHSKLSHSSADVPAASSCHFRTDQFMQCACLVIWTQLRIGAPLTAAKWDNSRQQHKSSCRPGCPDSAV